MFPWPVSQVVLAYSDEEKVKLDNNSMAVISTTFMFLLCTTALAAKETKEYWLNDARESINSIWKMKPNYKLAKNVILMIGDGMGLSTVTAGRIYQGQKNDKSGEETKLSFEEFPYAALSKTYCADRQVPDSAASGVSMVTGVKVNYGTLGVDADVPYGKDCTTMIESRKLKTILDYALEEGKSVGIVTTTRVTHATPGATYAHVPYRDWESDSNMAEAKNCQNVKDIAYQLVMDNPKINVILGGGRRYFTTNTTRDPVFNDTFGLRKDGLDLIKLWKDGKLKRNMSHEYVYSRQQLSNVDVSRTDYLLGLFARSHHTYETDRQPSDVEPTLAEMAETAIKILSRNPKGYFVLIEGGRIDQAHHDNYAKKALEELVHFNSAATKVTELTSSDNNTLVVVTADHSHVFGIAGYPSRGNDILGLVDIVDPTERPDDLMPYTTLGYLNGPSSGRVNLTAVNTTVSTYQQPGCIKMPYETHGGEDVSIYAKGPMAHLFQGTREQSYIGHVLMYSSCLGPYKDNCDMDKRNLMEEPTKLTSSAVVHVWSLFTLTAVVVILV
ncbi:hypothetical protein Btru_032947 [Bulinus truncatus]|nr:hypothetical protein Btru_032947 [Bulinus truncatus]